MSKRSWPQWEDVSFWFCEAGPNPVTLARFVERYPKFEAELRGFWEAWEELEGYGDLADMMRGR